MEFYVYGGKKLLHKYELNGLKIVIDVNSGCVHVFDDIAYEVVDYINQMKSLLKNILNIRSRVRALDTIIS